MSRQSKIENQKKNYKGLTKSQYKKKLLSRKFYKIIEEDLFSINLFNHYSKRNILHKNKFSSKFLLLLRGFYSNRSRKKLRIKKNSFGHSWFWVLSKRKKSVIKKKLKVKTLFSRYIKKFKYYYNNLSTKRIKNIGKSINKSFLSIFQTFLFKLETRLDVLAYRLHFCKSTREGKHFIKMKNICINDKLTSCHYETVSMNDIISISFFKRNLIFLKLLSKLEYKKIFFNTLKLKNFKNTKYLKQVRKPWQLKHDKKRKERYKVFQKVLKIIKPELNQKVSNFEKHDISIWKKILIFYGKRKYWNYQFELEYKRDKNRKKLKKKDKFRKYFPYNVSILYNYPIYLEVNWRILKFVLVRQPIFLCQENIPFFGSIYPELTYNYLKQ